MRLSKNFILQEFTNSDTANRLSIDNKINSFALENIKILVIEILQPLRNQLNQSIHINSGFRCLELNRALRSKDTSQHVAGKAVDITIYEYDNLDLANYIKNHFIFDQLILEFWEPDVKNGWVHISYDKEYNRKECLTINSNGTLYGLGK